VKDSLVSGEFGSLVGALGLGEAIAAVDRPAVAGLERYLGLFAAGSAHGGEHLAGAAHAGAGGTAAAGLFASGAAGGTTLGLVGEALGGEEFLLGGSEGEVRAAVCTLDVFVLGHGMTFAPFIYILGLRLGHPDHVTNHPAGIPTFNRTRVCHYDGLDVN